MTYSFSTGGSGWLMVPCMDIFLAEVEQCVRDGLLDVTNLGQLGDAIHKAEPTSRHNPAQAPDGQWYVCAADFGGKDYAKLAYFHQALYRAHDPRVYQYGFCQWGDGYGLSWPDGGREWTGRDQGHCHFDVTMKSGSLGSDWWTDALSSTAPWGLADWLKTGQLKPQTGSATPISKDILIVNDTDKVIVKQLAHDAFVDVMRSTEFANIVNAQVQAGLTAQLAGPGKNAFDRVTQAAQKAYAQVLGK